MEIEKLSSQGSKKGNTVFKNTIVYIFKKDRTIFRHITHTFKLVINSFASSCNKRFKITQHMTYCNVKNKLGLQGDSIENTCTVQVLWYIKYKMLFPF